MDYQAPAIASVFPQEVSGMVRSQVKDGDRVNQKVKENALTSTRIKLIFSVVMEASVISTEIGSFRGSVDGGSIDAESNTPRAGWDTMLDNCKGTKSAMGYHFEKKMNCLPEQLMASLCGVSSQ